MNVEICHIHRLEDSIVLRCQFSIGLQIHLHLHETIGKTNFIQNEDSTSMVTRADINRMTVKGHRLCKCMHLSILTELSIEMGTHFLMHKLYFNKDNLEVSQLTFQYASKNWKP